MGARLGGRCDMPTYSTPCNTTFNTDDHNCPVDTAERSSSADWRTDSHSLDDEKVCK